MKRRGIVLISLLLLSAACMYSVPVQPVKVEGTAMLPALHDGDRLVIERNPQKLERGDIIVFLFPEDQTKSYIKRIIGLPNEVVEIREGKVFVNETPLEEPYVLVQPADRADEHRRRYSRHTKSAAVERALLPEDRPRRNG